MAHTITCKGGPLHGKRYTIPAGVDSFTAEGGRYKVGPKQASWQPAAAPALAAADDTDADACSPCTCGDDPAHCTDNSTTEG